MASADSKSNDSSAEKPKWRPHRPNKDIDFSKLENNDVFIVCAARSPIGKYGGILSSLTAPQIESHLIKESLSHYNISVNEIDECIFGNAIQANIGQNGARIAALNAGISNKCPSTTINKVCASGMKSIQYGFDSIKLGYSNIIICGGFESMSNAPYYLLEQRFGAKMGHKTIIDGMIKDGLWDAFTDQHVGSCAELCAKKHNITREEQDNFAIRSFELAQKYTNNGIFESEIIPIPITLKNKNKNNKNIIYYNKDEGCTNLNINKLRQLKGAFNRDSGTITAGNASQLSDGAACIILCSGKYLKNRYNNKNINTIYPLCQVLSFGNAAQNPIDFATSPSLAIPIALSRINMKLNKNYIDFTKDYFEINEAFSMAGIANCKLLNIPISNTNIFGGSVAIGHPLGCSGARIIVTLINVLKTKNGRYGIAGICNGGGGATAMIIKNI